MTAIPTSHRDLLDAQVATLATIEADGLPQLSEVWFLADDDTVRISLNSARHKVTNLRQRPACGVLILDLANPYRYLEIRGEAEIASDDDYAFADRIDAKYGSDLRDMDKSGGSRVVVTVRPHRVRAWGS
jgi:PPOX class probable F420-dependent enzyme